VQAQILLADAAQVSPDGKVHVLGLGWQFTTSPTTPSAVVVLVHVPWDEANRKHTMALDLVTADGHPVMLPLADGSLTNIRVETQFEVGRPPGLRQGSSITFPFSAVIGPMPLQKNARFEWRLKIDGKEDPSWRVTFDTRE
jgi:hypothetical protein